MPRPRRALEQIVITGAGLVPTSATELLVAAQPSHPPRLARMDRLCALALGAAHAALESAGLAVPLDGGDRVAVVVGTRFGCHASNEAWYRSLLDEGVRGASPRLFAYTLPSSPLGEVCIHVGARGPGETFTDGAHAGLEAARRAAELCALGRADRAIALSVEVGGGTLIGLGQSVESAATALIFESEEAARARAGRVLGRILSAASAWTAGDPGEARAGAIARALAAAPRRGTTDGQSDEPCESYEIQELALGISDGAVEPLSAVARYLLEPANQAARAQAALCVQSDPGGGAAALVIGHGPRDPESAVGGA